MRLTSRWSRAPRLPTHMESTARIADERRPAVLHAGEAAEEDAKQDGEGGGLGRGRHHADDGRGCSLVDVGGPHVEGSGRDLEAETDDDHGDGEEGEGGGVADVPMPCGDAEDVGRPGGSEDERDAVEEEGGGEAAEQEVLDGGLSDAGGLALAEAGHDVGGDRRDFKTDEDHEELNGAGHEHHADGAKAG